MAGKEATVFIVDVGKSMNEKRQGRHVTDLEWSLGYVWDKITETVATERKTLNVGVIGVRTDGSENELDSEEAYKHISVLKGLGQVLMPDVRRLRDQLHPSSTDRGDVISALVIAIQMISTFCKKLQYQRRIILITDGRGAMDADDVEHIISKLKEDKIELIVLGVDFNDPEYGFMEEGKDEIKAYNEEALKKLCEDSNGIYGTIVQAIEELSIPRVKTVKPVHSFKGYLTLGNPEDYDSALAIDVERYPRVSVQKPPSASSFVNRSDMVPTQNALEQTGQDLAAVKNARTYQIVDEEAPGGKRDVEQEELAKGYSYGSTAVPISDSDRNVTTFETKQGLDLIGFVAKEQYERYMDMSKSNVIISMRTNDRASMALSSFIHALYELDSYGVARLVPKENKPPTIVLLAPSIELDHECLYEMELPFAEDLRLYRFPALDKVVTVSGKELKQHRNLPNDELMDAMSDYVDKMDLSTFGTDDDGNPSEYMPIDETFSPVLHRVNQVIRQRAVFPEKGLPPIPDILTKFSKPPERLLEKAQPALQKIVEAADVKKVPPRALSRRNRRDAPKPLSGLDVNALLTSNRKLKISAENAVPEFKQLVQAAEDVGSIQDACRQLSAIINEYIRHSVGDSGYGRALEAIRVMREECLDVEEAAEYNDFLRRLKTDVLEETLGGDRREMWFLLRRARLGPIQRKEQGSSDVSEEEAKEFMLFR